MLLKLRDELLSMSDEKYKAFQCKLMPTVDESLVIGIQTPKLRSLAVRIYKRGEAGEFLNSLPHFYYEENNLHAFLIEKEKNYDCAIELIDKFLPYVDNWATCDSLSPKVFSDNKDRLILKIPEWIGSKHVYTVRFGICMLMKHYLDEAFSPEYLKWVGGIKSEEYYIKMAAAWYFSVALVKQYDAAVLYIEKRLLDPVTHNKTISKAIDSYRINAEQKKYLKSLKY